MQLSKALAMLLLSLRIRSVAWRRELTTAALTTPCSTPVPPTPALPPALYQPLVARDMRARCRRQPRQETASSATPTTAKRDHEGGMRLQEAVNEPPPGPRDLFPIIMASVQDSLTNNESCGSRARGSGLYQLQGD
ncbi:hypothetical protein C7974DRAFT_84809 [Boeremia exigua]|uniref:uncharacterized protein n=1 Tax=Boeremia exigua TaxID=749465 RepID=UPI001E8DFF10|nr:uncharacterized protein C7974DRAFT_84809 [Boeremia exigua]KAH6612753.1 hypothetical protein C7974DRAFT_84809 [Boeremia exigua]